MKKNNLSGMLSLRHTKFRILLPAVILLSLSITSHESFAQEKISIGEMFEDQIGIQVLESSSQSYSKEFSSNAALADVLYDFANGSFPDNFSAINSGTYFSRTTSSNTWTVEQSGNTYQSGFSLKSGSITHNQNSNMGLLVNIEAGGGTLQFKYRTSTESGYDELAITVNDSLIAVASGENDWSDSPVFDIPAGEYYIDFWYTKDGSNNIGLDAVFVDNIAITGLVDDSTEPNEPVLAITNVSPNAAAPGSNVILYGSNFSTSTSGNTVTFDGTSASVVSASETKLVVTVPDIEPGFAEVSIAVNESTANFSNSFSVLQTFVKANFQLTDSGLRNVGRGSNAFEDVNGDGHIDLLITGSSFSRLYLNDGSGGYTNSGADLEAVSNSSVAFADVDGDGDPDLFITGSSNGPYISKLYLNNGSGEFSNSGEVFEGVIQGSVAFADVDADGDSDLLVTGRNNMSDPISKLYLNNGSGNFSDSEETINGVLQGSVAFADIEGDGDLDFLITGFSSSGLISKLYLNNGSGNFSDSGETLYGVNNSSVAFADVEGDGDLDLLITGVGTTRISYLYLNDGSGGFSNSGVTLEGVQQSSVAFADVEGDGDPDLLITGINNANQNISKLYLNNGSGGFSDSGVALEGVRYSSVAFADINGDGDLDLLLSGLNSSGSDVTNLYENKPPPFTINKVQPKAAIPGTRVTLYGTGFSPNVSDNMVSFGNTQAVINSASETKLEVTVPGNNPGSYTISIANDDETGEYSGIFTVLAEKDPYFKPAYTGLEGLRYGSSDFEDVDNDGDLDLFVTGTTSSNARISKLMVNDGEGNFSDVDTDIGTSSNSITAWGDIDNDGDKDLFISGVSSSGVVRSYLYQSDGSGSFTAITSNVDGIRYGEAEFGDLDNDGDLDLVITGFNTSSQRITKIYLNDGFGDFSYQSDLEGMHYSSLTLGDINGDNFLDIQLSGLNNSNVRVSRIYINNGSGGFNNTSSLEGVQYSTSDFIDIDNDADLDLLITGYNSSNQRISKLYINNGSGSYSDSGISLDGVMYGSTAIADIDGNGYQDLLITGYSSSGIRENDLYLNNGTGGIINSGISLEGIQEGDVAFGDIDGDGDLDLFISGLSTAGQYISKLYENDVPPFTITSLSSEAAAPGSKITLYGYGFHPNENENIVTLGPYQAVIISSDTTFMRVTVPDIEPGNYRISVSNDKGTANYADNFTVLNQKRAYFETSDNEFVDVYFTASNFGDLDSDGDQDLIITGYNSTSGDNIGFYLNDGTGAFTETENSFTAMRYGDIEFADVNNDGHLDALVAGYSAGASTKLYINDGEGNFTDTNHAIENFYYGAISVGDVDADGDLDLLISGTNSSNLRISKLYLNDGIGGFSLTDVSLEGIYQGSNAFSDIDSDGDLDILITGYNSSNVAVTRLYKNDGNANFTLATTSLDDVYRNSINFHDIDSDGDNDLLLTGQNSSNIRVSTLYLNDGNGNFTDSGQSFDGVMYSSSNIADVDGDGDYDVIISGNGNTGSITKIYLNDGSGQFNDSQLAFEGVQYGATNFSDIDGDGDLDFLLSGYTPSGTPITKLYNNIIPPGPSNLVAAVNDNSIELNWSPSPLTDIGGHNVYRSTSHISEVSNEWKLNTELLTGTTYTDINLQENTQYFYYVTAVDSLTGEESVLSNEAVANYKLKSIFATSVAGNIPGGSITLFGTHLSSNPADYEVHVGDSTASVSSSTTHSITIIVPELKPGNYPVSVALFGVQLTLPNPITVVEHIAGESGYFQSGVELSGSASAVRSVSAADLDLDGDFDVLSAFYNDNSIVWVENNNNQNFSSEENISTTIDGATDALAADLDNDGDLDFVTTSYNNDQVVWFVNDGNGGFEERAVLSETADGANSVIATDIDLDGDMDILAASELDDKISLFINNGIGSFSSEIIITSTANGIKALLAADVNGDGFADLISASYLDDTIGLFLNNGDGSFASRVSISSSADGVENIYSGDLNGDGYTDIISASPNDDTIAWYNNNGNGTFGSEIIISDSLDAPIDVHVADLNGDGSQDIISAVNGSVVWFANDGNGIFAFASTITLSKATSIYTADVTDNGTLDVLLGIAGSDQILLFKNIDAPPAPPSGLAAVGGIGSATLSWNSNTEPDILGYDVIRTTDPGAEFQSVLSDLTIDTTFTDTGLENARTYYYKIVAVDSSFNSVLSEEIEITAVSTQISRITPESGAAGTQVKLSGIGFSTDQQQNSVHFNNTEADIIQSDSLSLIVEVPSGLSGLVDLTVTSEDVEYINPAPFLVLTPNDGMLSTPLSHTGFAGVGNMVSADVNGDGDMDLMITRPSSNGLTLSYSQNRNPFNSLTNFNYSGVSPKKVRVMNVTGSNYPDFIFISQLNNQFRVMKNDGSGVTTTGLFNLSIISINNDTPEDIFPADMDNDGRSDVIISSSGDNKISWYKNLSIGSEVAFGTENIISGSAAGVTSIVAGDFNSDNLTDIVAVHTSESLIMYYENTGEGFTATVIDDQLADLRKVTASDIDGDGDIDVLSASSGDNKVVLHVNDGSGVFSSFEISSVNGVSDIVTADINGDGLEDVLATSHSDNSAFIFLNNGNNAFSEGQLISDDESGALQLIAYDMQGDGRLDVVTRSINDGKISAFRNIQVQGLTVGSFIGGDNIILTTDDVEIEWNVNVSEIADFTSLLSDAISITNVKGEIFTPSSVSVEGSSLILVQDSFYAVDTLKIEIFSDQLVQNSLGEFYLDVNNNGEKDSADDLIESQLVYTSFIGDFTRDLLVNFDDLVLFSDGWRSSDSMFETAPLSYTTSDADFPNARINGDGQFNIDDLISFIRYWNLSQDQNQAKLLAENSTQQHSVTDAKTESGNMVKTEKYAAQKATLSDSLLYISYKQEEKKAEYSDVENVSEVTYTFSISHPDSLEALELRVEYDPEELQIQKVKDHGLFNQSRQDQTVFISHNDTTNGILTLSIANFGDLSPMKEREFATITFESLVYRDSDLLLQSDIRTSGKPALLQAARKAVNVVAELPAEFNLFQNYPNPFNPTTTIHYELAEQARVSLDIYDLLGRKVETLINQNDLKAGYYKTNWNASRYASGMYIYVLNINSRSGKTHTLTKKMMMIK